MKEDIFAIVIGAGPAGLACSRTLSRSGKKVILVDVGPVGGVCLNSGCIPTKYRLARLDLALQEVLQGQRQTVNSLVNAIENSLRRIGVEIIYGKARLIDNNVVEVNGNQIKAQKIILAVGSSPKKLPGLEFDDNRVFSAEQMLWQKSFYDTSKLHIVGAGPIGIEFAFMMRHIFDQVTVYDIADEILPVEDKDIASRLRTIMRKQGINFELGKDVDITSIKGGYILVGIGRIPRYDMDFLLNNINLDKDSRGFIKTKSTFETSVENIYAIGECRGGIFLANPAAYEGKQLARILLGESMQELKVVPRCVFSNPVACFVGKKSDDLLFGDIAFPHGEMKFIYPISGKMKIGVDNSGIIKYAAILGPGASELVSFFELAIKKQIKFEELKSMLYVHPTLSEAISRIKVS